MDIARIATTRYTSKAFDPSRKIPAAQIEQLKTLLRYSPSSTNSQPWHFVLASTEAGKAKVAESTSGFMCSTPPGAKRLACGGAVRAQQMTDAHLARLLAQEEQDAALPRRGQRPARTTAAPTLPICTALT